MRPPSTRGEKTVFSERGEEGLSGYTEQTERKTGGESGGWGALILLSHVPEVPGVTPFLS